MEHKIIVAGMGPGGAEYVVPQALKAIQEARALVGGKRLLEQYGQNNSQQKQRVIDRDIAGVMAFVDENLANQDVVVMVSGDPGYYSLLDALRRNFPGECLQVIPGISSFQLAFAKLAMPWHDAKLLSFHGRIPAKSQLKYTEDTVLGILTDAKYNSRTIPEILLEQGWPLTAKLYICSRLSYEDEQIIATNLADARKLEEYKHCVLVVTE